MTDDRNSEIAALERRLTDLKRAPITASRPRKTGAAGIPWFVWTLMALGALWLLSWFAMPAASSGEGQKATEAADSAGPCETAASSLVFASMEQQGLIRGSEVSGDVGGVLIVVRAASWNSMRVANQERLIAAADCAIAGPGKHLTKIVVRGSRSGPDIDVYDSGDLLRLRERGLAQFSQTAP